LPNTFSKQERALLRRLAEEAWESELRAGLEALFETFRRWADSGMSTFELNDRIHDFHDGISRELYKRYATGDPGAAVAYAIAAGHLDEDAIAPALLEKLAPAIEVFRGTVRLSAARPRTQRLRVTGAGLRIR
jgi:hypothetical protein